MSNKAYKLPTSHKSGSFFQVEVVVDTGGEGVEVQDPGHKDKVFETDHP